MLSKLPFWQQLKQQLALEQQQVQGLQQHAVQAASDDVAPQAHNPWSSEVAAVRSGQATATAAAAAAGSTLPLLQQLREAATAERSAAERFISLAMQ